MIHPNDKPEMPTGTWLLGIDWGHLLTYEDVYKKDENGNPTIETEYQVQTTTGMMCVSPAWHLLDLLNDPALVAERDKIAMEKEREKRPAPTTALDFPLPLPKPKRKGKVSRTRASNK